jgi:hypothetical protein
LATARTSPNAETLEYRRPRHHPPNGANASPHRHADRERRAEEPAEQGSSAARLLMRDYGVAGMVRSAT